MIRLLRTRELGVDGVVATLAWPHAAEAPDLQARVAAIVEEVRRVAGPNHVLPTAGAARFASGLSVENFVKRSSVIHYSAAGLSEAWPYLSRLAAAEGLQGHGEAARIRVEHDGEHERGD